MGTVYISADAGAPLKDYLLHLGYEVSTVRDEPLLGKGVSSHPDLMMCKTGALPEHRIIFFGAASGSSYPENAAFCAILLEKYLIHRLDITSNDILKYAQSIGLRPVNVRQGYAKCGAVVVDGRAIISSDPGMISALSALNDVDVLSVSPGHVRLTGFEYGFLGGASGRVGSEIVFNGDLSAHPDFHKIRAFIEARGLSVKYFSEYELTDIGSIIEYSPKMANRSEG